MTACWRRLTQPEKRRRKAASGGGSGSMGKACPRGRPGSRGASLGYRRPADRGRGSRGTSLLEGVDPPISWRSVLGRVLAPDGKPGPHPLLDCHRSGDEGPRVPALRQWSSRPCGPGGAHAGTGHGGRQRPGECPVVSLAVALPWALSDADGGVRRMRDANDRHPSSFECPCGTNVNSPPGEVHECKGQSEITRVYLNAATRHR
jgi:hypothetical protein